MTSRRIRAAWPLLLAIALACDSRTLVGPAARTAYVRLVHRDGSSIKATDADVYLNGKRTTFEEASRLRPESIDSVQIVKVADSGRGVVKIFARATADTVRSVP